MGIQIVTHARDRSVTALADGTLQLDMADGRQLGPFDYVDLGGRARAAHP